MSISQTKECVRSQYWSFHTAVCLSYTNSTHDSPFPWLSGWFGLHVLNFMDCSFPPGYGFQTKSVFVNRTRLCPAFQIWSNAFGSLYLPTNRKAYFALVVEIHHKIWCQLRETLGQDYYFVPNRYQFLEAGFYQSQQPVLGIRRIISLDRVNGIHYRTFQRIIQCHFD